MLSKLEQAVAQYSLFEKGDTIAVGLSGGADSVSLLHALVSLQKKLDINVIAVHIDHSIRGREAQRDMLFCVRFCEKLGVELICRKVDVPKIAKEQGIGLEECGRNCRYEIFGEISKERNAKIATAHTLSDNVETVLFNLARGTSVGGLSGIPAKRSNIIRPLILCTREQVEAYCEGNGLDFVTDSTNFDTAYSRNLIRHKIIPELKRINPSLSEAVLKLAGCAAADEEFLSSLACEQLQKAQKAGGYDSKKLCGLDRALLSRAIRIACNENKAQPQNVHIELIEKCIAQGFGAVTLPGKIRASVKNGVLCFDKEESVRKTSAEEWAAEASLGENILPDGRKILLNVVELDEFVKRFDINRAVFAQFVDNVKNQKIYFKNCINYDIISDKLCLRNRRAGDKFSPQGRGVSKSIKELMRESGIPANERGGAAMLEYCGKLCWIEGFGTAEGFAIGSDTKRILTVEVIV